MKVLVAVEDLLFGSAMSRFISEHHWPDSTQFHVVHVLEPFFLESSEDAVPAPQSSILEPPFAEIKAEAANIVNEFVASLQEGLPGHNVSGEVICGRIKDEIISSANELGADLIVAGSHGRSGFSRFFLGSVSLMLVNESRCPVLLIKPDSSVIETWNKLDAHSLSSSEIIKRLHKEYRVQTPQRIMIALDETGLSESIIDFVIGHKWKQPVHFKLINVLKNPNRSFFPPSDAAKEFYEDSLKVHAARLRRMALKMRDKYHSPHIEEEIVEGDPKDAIVENARLWGADLLILGCRYRPALQKFVPGSVSMAALCTSLCPVLLLRERAESHATLYEEAGSQEKVQTTAT